MSRAWEAPARYALGSAAHARGMDGTGSRRSRCRVCRSYVHADRRAATQKVCSAACRLVWRRNQAKQRRAGDLEGHREADRARQQTWRDAHRVGTGPPAATSQRVTPARRRRRATPTPAATSQRVTPATSSRRVTPTPATSSRRVTPPSSEGLSRAGIASQPHGRKEEILLAWDKAARLSRAGLARDLSKIFGEDAPILGQAGQDRGPVTRRERGSM
jgi:hypothetical protein